MENLSEILALQKQVGILIGAGVSRACELPDVASLTNEIRKKINNENFINNAIDLFKFSNDLALKTNMTIKLLRFDASDGKVLIQFKRISNKVSLKI